MADDWRIHVTVGDEADGLLDRLGDVLGGEAGELAEELEQRRLAVSRDGDELFVYAASRAEAERAGEIVEAVLREHSIEATTSPVEHWLEDEERWDDEPPGETWEEDELERGYAPWEVRVDPPVAPRGPRRSRTTLEDEGYSVERRWQLPDRRHRLEGGRRGARERGARRGRAGRRARLGDRAGEPVRHLRRPRELGDAAG